MRSKPELLDVVELREPRGGYPVGTVGAVVELLPSEALVEVVDEHGETLDLLSVPYEDLQLRPSEPVQRRAAG